MNILIVDDNDSLARGLQICLQDEGYEACAVFGVEEAISKLKNNEYDLVITDLRLDDGSGLDVIKAARATEVELKPEVILMTAFGSVETSVEAMKLGAVDYLIKPVSMEEFIFRVGKIKDLRKLEKKNSVLQRSKKSLIESSGFQSPLEQIVGSSNGIMEVKKLIEKVAAFPSTVLITGETGVGKEMVARAVHNLSNRKDGPFVRVNCASIPATLFESELFGHEKGAFTDAKARRIGRFEASHGGTIFLDEVGEVPVELQAKLLRTLQEKEIVRVGGTKAIKVDTRIVAATNRNLESMVAEQKFREDLLYRLGVVTINIPPLRQRKSDVALLCKHLLQKLGNELGRPNLKISDSAIDHLTNLNWPGNIRELRNRLEMAIVMADSNELKTSNFSVSSSNTESIENNEGKTEGLKIVADEGLISALERIEKELILTALDKNNGVKSKAADELKIPRTQLLYRMKRLGIK